MRWAHAPDLFEPPSGELIDAITIVRVAKHLGCPPWELVERPLYWLYLGMTEMELSDAQSS